MKIASYSSMIGSVQNNLYALASKSGVQFANKEYEDGSNFFGKDGLTIGDAIDAINPLNNLPVVSSFFGNDESPASKIAGSALYGGPLGVVASLFNSFVEGETGKTFADHIIALFDNKPDAEEAASKYAKVQNFNEEVSQVKAEVPKFNVLGISV